VQSTAIPDFPASLAKWVCPLHFAGLHLDYLLFWQPRFSCLAARTVGAVSHKLFTWRLNYEKYAVI
jgi:hypothetical protein